MFVNQDPVLRDLQLEIIHTCGVLILHGSLVCYDTKCFWVYVDIRGLFVNKWHDAGEEEDHCVFPKGALTP